MKSKLARVLVLFLSVHLISGCSSPDIKTVVATTDDTIIIKKLVQDWSNAHLSKDVGAFSDLFDSTVFFYGVEQDKNACIESKLSLFRKFPDFYQQIYGDVLVEKVSDTEVKCSFVKRVTINKETSDYPSYLTFTKFDSLWRIVTEGDLVTDKSLAKRTETKKAFITKTSEKSSPSTSNFISGLKAAKVYSKEEAERGSKFKYQDGRKFDIDFYYEQVDVLFYARNENNQRQRVMTNFEAGYSSPDDEMLLLKDKANFLVGQYDFDGDNIDELVIALQDNDESDNGLSINVFKLKSDTWELIGDMTGKLILGDPKAEVKMNKITIPRNLRGFYYQWTLESGKFKDTGDY